MPPEQAKGETSRIDARADVFALGAMLCEILTGRPPYTADSADETCRLAFEGDLSDAYARLDACGADKVLRDLARQCLAGVPSARPADAGVVAAELSAYLAAVQERLRRAQVDRAAAEATAETARAKAKTERRARRLALALAAALLLGTAVTAWQAGVAIRAKETAVTAAAGETVAKEAAQTKEAEAQAVLRFL
jgi:serine/threonine-protein kinase